MKKKALFLVIAIVVAAGVWALGAWLLATKMPFRQQTQTTVITLEVPEGAYLHVDTGIRAGAVRFRVTGEKGSVYADETLTRSYNYAVKAYRGEAYTVSIDYQQADGQATVYLTDEDGNPLSEVQDTAAP